MPRTTTCWMVSTTTPTPSISSTEQILSFFRPWTRSRSSRCRQQISALILADRLVLSSTLPSRPVQTAFTARSGNFFGMTSSTRRTGLPTTMEPQKESCASINSEPPSGDRSFKNKLFYFGDYEGLRVVQGTVSTASVPTLTMRNSGYSNLSDIITGQGGTLRADAVGRQVPLGTVLDPATTRTVVAGIVDPVSGMVATTTGYVRDPFGTCSPSTATYSRPPPVISTTFPWDGWIRTPSSC